MHSASFEDEDENKLEYTPIFEAYVKILEDIIEAKLREKHNQGAIDAFYQDFKSNFEAYKSIDDELVQRLFEFTDFNKFKAGMIERKKGLNADKAAGATSGGVKVTADSDIDNSFAIRLFEEDVNVEANEWKKRSDFNEPNKGLGIVGTVHTKSIPGFNVHWTRSEGLYNGINLPVYDYLMKHVEEVYAKKEGITDMVVTDKTPDGEPLELYATIKMPMFMSNRDLHIRFIKSEPRPGLFLYTSTTINKPEYAPPSGTLRMNMFAYSFVE